MEECEHCNSFAEKTCTFIVNQSIRIADLEVLLKIATKALLDIEKNTKHKEYHSDIAASMALENLKYR